MWNFIANSDEILIAVITDKVTTVTTKPNKKAITYLTPNLSCAM